MQQGLNEKQQQVFLFLQYKIERQWILSLLLDGLRETADYRIFERKYTFKLLQGFYDSDLSDTPTQVFTMTIEPFLKIYKLIVTTEPFLKDKQV